MTHLVETPLFDLPSSWQKELSQYMQTAEPQRLCAFLQRVCETEQVYPPQDQWFRAFHETAFDDVKVVILGQDPYHGAGQAHGLSFSVEEGVKVPPSLKNIYKELSDDVGAVAPDHGCLVSWAQQGVLLLNSVLTVSDGAPASHKGQGWEMFTDEVMRLLSERKEGLVFILWGAYAQKKGAFIDRDKHCVIESAHPSPFSARHGFLGSRPFSRANAYLVSHACSPIEWQLPASSTGQAELKFGLSTA